MGVTTENKKPQAAAISQGCVQSLVTDRGGRRGNEQDKKEGELEHVAAQKGLDQASQIKITWAKYYMGQRKPPVVSSGVRVC